MELVAVDYTSPTAKQDFVRSLRDTGFGVLKNHPLRQEEVQEIYDDWRQFFSEDRKNDFAVPHNGAGGFYPQSLEKGLRSERALKLAIAEMYVTGVSTRKVAQITQELCGFEVTSTQVSRAAQSLDEELEAWRIRPVGDVPYLVLDARYEKVRHGGAVVDVALLVAVGVQANGKRSILGVSVSLSEAEVHWRTFLSSLVDRGLHGMKLIVSDDHAGLGQARQALVPSVPWQRCQCHLQRNAQAYVPKVAMRAEVAQAIQLRAGAKPHLHQIIICRRLPAKGIGRFTIGVLRLQDL